jgi:hypothetical protein
MPEIAPACAPHILLISPMFIPVETAEAIVNAKLVMEFLRAGWSVDVLTRLNPVRAGDQYGVEWNQPWLTLRDHVFQIESGLEPLVNATRNLFDRKLPRAVATVRRLAELRWARRAAKWALRRHREHPYDVVLSRSLPEVAHLAAMWFVRKSGVPWIANWNDPTAAKTPRPYAGGPDAPLSKVGSRLLSAVAREASWHTFPSEPLRKYVIGYMPVDIASRSSVIPHIGVRLVDQPPRERGEAMVICHNGDLRMPRDPDSFYAGVAKFVRQSPQPPRIQILISGKADDPARASAARHGVESFIKLIGPRPYAQSQEVLLDADVAVVIEAPCEQPIFLPSKLIDYATLDRPTLAVTPADSAVAQLITRYGGGAVAPCGDADAVGDALRSMYSSWQAGNLARDFDTSRLYELFKPQTILQTYLDLFAKLGVKNVDLRMDANNYKLDRK